MILMQEIMQQPLLVSRFQPNLRLKAGDETRGVRLDDHMILMQEIMQQPLLVSRFQPNLRLKAGDETRGVRTSDWFPACRKERSL